MHSLSFTRARCRLDGYFPTLGAWAHYGLGSLNDNLPQFVVLGNHVGSCGGPGAHGADYLSPEHDSVSLKVDLHNPLPFALPQSNVYRVEQELSNRLLGRLNRLASSDYPEDPVMRARIKLCLRWLRSVCRA